MVNRQTISFRSIVTAGEVVAVHLVALIVGFVLMVIGLALGVTMVLLPFGIVVGFAGIFVFLWGLLEYSSTRRQP